LDSLGSGVDILTDASHGVAPTHGGDEKDENENEEVKEKSVHLLVVGHGVFSFRGGGER